MTYLVNFQVTEQLTDNSTRHPVLMQAQYCLSLFGGTGSYLWGMNQIHFQETGLKVAFCRAVVFQGIQQKGCALLQKTVLHEHIHNLLILVKVREEGCTYTHVHFSVYTKSLARQESLDDVMILSPVLCFMPRS